MRQLLLTLTLAGLLLSGCTTHRARYVIGVSQCSGDIWRDKQNAELLMGSYFHEDVELRFAAAYDSDERQVQQIDSLMRTGIDLLIVAPNQVATITPAIDRAYDQGIPVIVFERKTDSKKYTAYIGADNYEMGRLMGEYIATRLHGNGRVLEIMGLKGSSPAIERHKGFTDALSHYPGIQAVATLQGDWTEQSAIDAINSYQGDLSNIDFVFGQNDRMAMGARKALSTLNPHPSTLNPQRTPLYCGIDGLPGENGGIRLVRDSLLDATYIYPTHGDQLLDLAIDILDGQHYDKEIMLMGALVTRDNANVLLMQSEETIRQTDYLNRLHVTASNYLQQLDTQRLVTFLLAGIAGLLLITAVVIYRYFRQRGRINREREEMARAQLDFYTQVSHELRTPLTLVDGPLQQLAGTDEMRQASPATQEMLTIVRRNADQLTQLISKMLDKEQSGSLKETVNSQAFGEEQGTNYEVREIQANSQEPTANGQANSEKETILVVDDNDDIRTYLRTILQQQYHVLEAADGQSGLDVAREQVPDLIVSDVMMPVMNGLQFCQYAKDDMATSHIPVILLTARALSQHQVEGYRSGADAYITKPFSPDVLVARIENLLHSRQKLKDLFGATTEPTEPKKPAPEDPFISKFRSTIEQHMADSELSVEDIGAQLGMSRVQLYRKVKALTGFTPVEQLRKARLSHARQLLLTTTLSVSEVAYQVGFTAPSYFTKCFKEEFGMLPGDARSNS